jgi:hypothetical protein
MVSLCNLLENFAQNTPNIFNCHPATFPGMQEEVMRKRQGIFRDDKRDEASGEKMK